jgi:hypothetical protein
MVKGSFPEERTMQRPIKHALTRLAGAGAALALLSGCVYQPAPYGRVAYAQPAPYTAAPGYYAESAAYPAPYYDYGYYAPPIYGGWVGGGYHDHGHDGGFRGGGNFHGGDFHHGGGGHR